MNSYIDQFNEYLKKIKKMAANSINAYIRDLNEFEVFLHNKGILNSDRKSVV